MSEQIQTCPFCGLSHPAGALFCPITGQELIQPATLLSPDEVRACPSCGAVIAKSANFCPICNADVAVPLPGAPLPDNAGSSALPPAEIAADTRPTPLARRRRIPPILWIAVPLAILLCLGLVVAAVWVLRNGINLSRTPVLAWVATGTPAQTTPPLPGTTLPPPPTGMPTLTATASGTSAASPDQPQGRIIYICQIFTDNTRDQICIINADGSGQKRISPDDHADYLYVVLAPDGQKVLYAKRTGPVYQIFEMNLDGSGEKQLTDNTYGSYDADVSADNSSIVYVKNMSASENSNAIWIMDRDGSHQHQVFGPPDGIGWDPSWSPDGQQILFMRDITTSYQLFVMDKDGANLQQITNLPLLRGRSDWSPDGNSIVTYAGATWQHEIYLMDRSGANVRQVTQGGNSQGPGFSPDGNWIVFTAYFDKMNDANGCEIYIMQLQTQKVTRLTNNDYCDWQPRWGP